ncbi:alpha/beta hydrolase [Bizionia sediminis]|uniref:Alpha/beta hydrolase n=1 Tax=Bizionia sediminis TaxID=1737064 RepID=A0ABW5KPF0_9FLAO
MNQDIIHVYCMPGLAANPTIFEHIKLPKSQFKIHWLEWLIPNKTDTLSSYAKRLAASITEANVVLIGVSFGGVVVQEMSKFISVKRLIIISSLKTASEKPTSMKIMRATKAYAFLPTALVGKLDMLSKFAVNQKVAQRIELYKKYLSVTDKRYLKWAIKQMVCWQQETALPNLIHIHGTLDHIFPYERINGCITVENGTHIMILNKYRWFNKHLPQLILEGSIAGH